MSASITVRGKPDITWPMIPRPLEAETALTELGQNLISPIALRQTDSQNLRVHQARSTNRLAPDRISDLLSDECLIEYKSLLERFVNQIR